MEEKELTVGQQLRKALTYQRKNGYDCLQPGELEAIEVYCEGYKQYLDAGKTERIGNGGMQNRAILFVHYTTDHKIETINF